MPYKIFWGEDSATIEWSGKVSYEENIDLILLFVLLN